MKRIIEVIVSPLGDTTVQTKGFSGSECREASKFLEQTLGIITSDYRTSECYQTTPVEQQVQQ